MAAHRDMETILKDTVFIGEDSSDGGGAGLDAQETYNLAPNLKSYGTPATGLPHQTGRERARFDW